MSQDVVLARASGVKLVERQGHILVVNEGTGWVNTATFVVGLFTFILVVNGSIQLALSVSGQGGELGLAIALWIVGGMSAAALVALARFARRKEKASPEELGVRLDFNLHAGSLCDGQGRVLAPLAHLRLQHKLQMGSSSPALVAVFPGGTALIVRGNPFGGGIGPIERELQGRMRVGWRPRAGA